MPSARQAKREQFFEAFGAYVECIAAMEVPKISQTKVPFESFRALLICTHLDTLAKARFGGNSTGSRFRKLLEQEAGHDPTYRLVALERLSERLHRKHANQRALDTVSALLTERWKADIVVRGMFDSNEVDVDADVVVARLLAAGLSLTPASPLMKAMDAERYSHIVWRDYRCGLVHESRVVNSGFNPQPYVDRLPFYCTSQPSGREVRELVIPTRFLLRTLGTAVDRYRAYCDQNDVDPYAALGIL